MSELTERTLGGRVEHEGGAEVDIGQTKRIGVQELEVTENTMPIIRTLVLTLVVLTFFILLYFTYDKQNTFYYDQLDENRINHSATTELFSGDYSRI